MEFLLQLAFVLACFFYGARKGGMALGLLGGIGPGLVAALLATLTIDYFFLPPKYTLRFNPAELPELLVYFVSADLSQFAVITELEKKAK